MSLENEAYRRRVRDFLATQVPEATESVVARAPPLVEGPEV